MAAFFQPRPDLRRVEYFTIEHDPNSPVFIVHRLVTTVEIDDAEATHGKGNQAVGASVFAMIVGTTMGDNGVHPLNPFRSCCPAMPTMPHMFFDVDS